MKAIIFLILVFCCTASSDSFAQDTAVKKGVDTTAKKEIVIRKKHDPKKATFRSAVLPGWGQAYNREYWKIPIVWGALGTCVGFWVRNNTWYQRTRTAYIIRINNDTSRFPEIHKKLTGLDAPSLQTYRNTFRRDRDYSLLYFLAAWGLNVADATVFAHLKEFDVSDDLSMKVTPRLDPIARTAGFTLAFNVK
jgi:hypothetical protein